MTFIGEGDLSVTSLRKGKQVFANSRIPLKKYRGITILFDIAPAQQTLNRDFRQANLNLLQIRDTLCGDGRSLLIKSKHEVDHIFGELFHVDEQIRLPYFWIKTIELLLFFEPAGWKHSTEASPVFRGSVRRNAAGLPIYHRESFFKGDDYRAG